MGKTIEKDHEYHLQNR